MAHGVGADDVEGRGHEAKVDDPFHIGATFHHQAQDDGRNRHQQIDGVQTAWFSERMHLLVRAHYSSHELFYMGFQRTWVSTVWLWQSLRGSTLHIA